MGYSEADLAAVPEGVHLGFGCGNPLAIAALQPGETVVDLGIGAGFDYFLAAQRLGTTGHVIGVDMTYEMLKRRVTTQPALARVMSNSAFGELEHLPIADNTAEVVISNCDQSRPR